MIRRSSAYESLRGLLAIAGQQELDAVRHVGALRQPMLYTGHVQTQLDLGAACHRIEQSHVLEAGSALPLAAVGHDDVVERGLLAAAPGQTNRHHLESTLQSVAANCSDKR